MTDSQTFSLATQQVEFTPTGAVSMVRSSGRAHPSVKGRIIGEAVMKKSPPHHGERHPDGDELLYLLDGAVEVELEETEGVRTVPVLPGQAFVVPQGIWHRVLVREPCRLLFMTPGRSEVRRSR